MAALTCAGLTGCAGMATVVQQLKDDPNCVDLDVQTLYGHGHIFRFGVIPGMTVSKASDGGVSVTYPLNPTMPRPNVPIVTNTPALK